MSRMIAKIRRGKNKDKFVRITQWCNNWFGTIEADIMSPTRLLFSVKDMAIIKKHDNNGSLFLEFEVISIKKPVDEYFLTFQRKS